MKIASKKVLHERAKILKAIIKTLKVLILRQLGNHNK